LDLGFGAGGTVRSTDASAVGVVVAGSVIRVGGGGRESGSREEYVFVQSYDERGKPGVRLDTLPVTDYTGIEAPGGGAVASAGAGRLLLLGELESLRDASADRQALVAAFGNDATDAGCAGNGSRSTGAV